MFEKTRKAMLKLSPASRVKVAGQVLGLLKRKREREQDAVLTQHPSQPVTSSDSNMLTSSELAQQKQALENHMAQLKRHYPNVKVV